TFHRIIQDFMIQGGCPEGSGRGGPGYRFEDELPAPGRYEIGSLAMANAGPNTNGSQIFIVSGPHGVALPPQYSLSGRLIDGFEVLDQFERVPTGPQDRPRDQVRIESVTITESRRRRDPVEEGPGTGPRRVARRRRGRRCRARARSGAPAS